GVPLERLFDERFRLGAVPAALELESPKAGRRGLERGRKPAVQIHQQGERTSPLPEAAAKSSSPCGRTTDQSAFAARARPPAESRPDRPGSASTRRTASAIAAGSSGATSRASSPSRT